jgi:methionyl-tRNA formyltransferase
MRIVFIGTVQFSLRALEHLLALSPEIVGVCTLPESQFNADHVDLSVISEAHGLPWIYAEDINSAKTLQWIRDRKPEVIFCFGWSRLLKQELLDIPPYGVVGYHPAALPANRGRHPIIWALVLGLQKTASTFFFMDAGADSGDILSQNEILIDDEDDARSLYEKVTQTALKQMEEFVPRLVDGTFKCMNQDASLENTWRKRDKADGKIDWRMTAHAIHNLVRGLSKPYVGAHFNVNDQEIKVWKAAVVSDVRKNIEPGKVLSRSSSGFVVKCGEDAICLVVTYPHFDPIIGTYL